MSGTDESGKVKKEGGWVEGGGRARKLYSNWSLLAAPCPDAEARLLYEPEDLTLTPAPVLTSVSPLEVGPPPLCAAVEDIHAGKRDMAVTLHFDQHDKDESFPYDHTMNMS